LDAAVCVIAQASQASPVIAPGLIFILCLAAAIGVILLLPGRGDTPLRAAGGVVLISSGIIFFATLAKLAAGVGAYFWIFSTIAILAAVRVITHPKPVYSALYFVLTVMSSAGLFVLMNAEFMAAALVLIYAGAILVTYVFVIMLAAEASPGGTSGMRSRVAEHDAVSREPIVASAVGFAVLGVVLFVLFDRTPALPPASAPQASASGFTPQGPTQRLGEYLFRKQLVNLELAGLILTVAMVGAIVIARKRVVSLQGDGQPIGREVLTAPMTPVNDDPHSIPVVGTENPRQKEYPET
jgi:NADH-quinone oxidoreductase subunit J